MRFLEGIINRQRMEAKLTKNRFGRFNRLVDEIHPEQPAYILNETLEFSGGNVNAKGLSGGIEEGTDHKVLPLVSKNWFFLKPIEFIDLLFNFIDLYLTKFK